MNNWYENLNKAPWSPPNYVFGIIWPILYVLMFISFFLVYFNKKCYPYCKPITYFLIQLVLNLSWTTVFFRFRQLLLGLVMIVAIILITLYTAYKFYSINRLASALLIPYILWLCVAFSLNLYIILMN